MGLSAVCVCVYYTLCRGSVESKVRVVRLSKR